MGRRVDVDFPSWKIVAKPLLLDQILWDDYSTLERQVKRLKLALSKDVYVELFARIKEANQQLKQFTKEGRVLEPSRRKNRSRYQSVDFNLIRRHAKSLYSLMVTGKSWKCPCRRFHVASLRLEPRPCTYRFK